MAEPCLHPSPFWSLGPFHQPVELRRSHCLFLVAAVSGHLMALVVATAATALHRLSLRRRHLTAGQQPLALVAALVTPDSIGDH
jgi:hypothetical protein